jgi:hypothetical protein
MAGVIYWPETLRPQQIKVDLAHRSLRGSTAQSGFTQVVSNSAGIWTVTYDEIPVYSSQMIRLWRALDSLIEGPLGIISLPAWDFPRSPSAMDELGLNIYKTPIASHNDGSYFSDYSGYVSSWTNIYVSADANIGATTISFTKDTPVTLEPGHRFSINDRLYQIRTVTSQSNTLATVTIRPPLREAILICDRAEFDYPRVKVRLTDDKAMQLDLDYNAKSFVTLSFFEAV